MSFGQVITRVLSPETEVGKYIPWYNPNDKIPQVSAPTVNVAAVLEEDYRTGRVMPRIGIKQNVNFTTSDGQLIKKDNYVIWNMTLYSKDAKSMSIKFEETHLPQNATMFLYNEDSKFIVGPITNIDFRSGTFLSDYLNGNRMTISILIPTKQNKEKFSINITAYNFGIVQLMDSFQDDDFENSQPCNVNVACSQTTGLEC